MLNTTLKALVWMIVLLLSAPVFSNSPEEGENVDVTEMIMHHIKDAHEWHILSYPGENDVKQHVSVPLPIILIDNGIQVFSSKRLYHEKEAIEIVTIDGGKDHYVANEELGYGMFHEKIYKLNAAGLLDFDSEGNVTNEKPYDFSITKNVFTLFFSALVLFLLLKAAVKSYKSDGLHPPRGIARFIEPIVIFVRDDIAKANIGETKYKKFMPYLLTAFFFIWINNMLGLIPIFPGGANLTGNISFTLTLAVLTMLVTVFSGNKNYWIHILDRKSTRLNSSHVRISYAVFCLTKESGQVKEERQIYVDWIAAEVESGRHPLGGGRDFEHMIVSTARGRESCGVVQGASHCAGYA